MYVRSRAAAEYARQWCYEVLMNSPCGEAGCRLPTVELLSYCDPDDPDAGLRYLHEVGLVDRRDDLTIDDVVPVGDAVPFGARLKVPPGVRGSQERAPDVLAEGPARTNSQRVARVEGEVLDFSEECR